jgi:hypothetical protein
MGFWSAYLGAALRFRGELDFARIQNVSGWGMSISKEQLQQERKRYEKFREETERILKSAPDSDFRDAKLEELKNIDAAIASIDEALAREP